MSIYEHGYWNGSDSERKRIVRLIHDQIARLSDQYAQRSDAHPIVLWIHALEDLVQKIEKEAR